MFRILIGAVGIARKSAIQLVDVVVSGREATSAAAERHIHELGDDVLIEQQENFGG